MVLHDGAIATLPGIDFDKVLTLVRVCFRKFDR
jgi:hypothetical protein